MQTKIQNLTALIADLSNPNQVATPPLAAAIAQGKAMLDSLNQHVAVLQTMATEAETEIAKANKTIATDTAQVARIKAAAAAAIAPATETTSTTAN